MATSSSSESRTLTSNSESTTSAPSLGERWASVWERTRARLASERVATSDDNDDNDIESNNSNSNTNTADADDNDSYGSQDLVSDAEDEAVGGAGRIPSATTAETTTPASSAIDSLPLAALHAEREAVRRRSSLCSLVAVVVLLKLWIDAMVSQDFGFIMLCLIGTSWTARILRHHQDREDELDEMIANYQENGNNSGNNSNRRQSLRMLNYQAQLALAIMESQRQMMEGGYGHPDGGPERPGVSDQAKATWKQMEYNPADEHNDNDPHQPTKGNNNNAELPHCSICLGEYEAGEALTVLPVCHHMYHRDCIDGWTRNHTKCPLCNLELENNNESNSNTIDPPELPLEVV